MGETTGISWADRTWSPWTGCAKVSPACDGCYAAHLMDTRMHRVEWGEPGAGEGTRSKMSAAYWKQPFAWDRQAAKTGVRPWVFPSLCDPFDLAVDGAWHAHFHEVIVRTPNVFWLLLTKRIGNVRKVAEHGAGRLWSARNWAAGATFANQQEWDRDGEKLRDVGQAFEVMTFGSFEPMLSRVRFGHAMLHSEWMPDWIIAGGETDQGAHKARPSHPDWFRGLRDQAAAAGKVFHFKQWGEWAPALDAEGFERSEGHGSHGARLQGSGWHVFKRGEQHGDTFRVGKARAGRLLDGVLHDARPEVS